MAYWIPRVGHNMISSVSIDIGGHQIDKQTGEWLNIYDELTRQSGLGKINEGRYDEMIGCVDGETTYIKKSPITTSEYYSDYSDVDTRLCNNSMPLLTHVNGLNNNLKILYSNTAYDISLSSGIYTGPKITDLIKTSINATDGLSGFSSSYYVPNSTINVSASSGFTIYGNSTANTTLGITNNLVSADGTAVWFQKIYRCIH